MEKEKDEKNGKEVFSTRDLYLASVLVTLRFFNIGIDFQNEGVNRMPVGYFSFDKTPELIAASRKYAQGQLAVEPRLFITNLKALKSQCNDYYKSPNNYFGKEKEAEK
jgi:hypothetical protein